MDDFFPSSSNFFKEVWKTRVFPKFLSSCNNFRVFQVEFNFGATNHVPLVEYPLGHHKLCSPSGISSWHHKLCSPSWISSWAPQIVFPQWNSLLGTTNCVLLAAFLLGHHKLCSPSGISSEVPQIMIPYVPLMEFLFGHNNLYLPTRMSLWAP